MEEVEGTQDTETRYDVSEEIRAGRTRLRRGILRIKIIRTDCNTTLGFSSDKIYGQNTTFVFLSDRKYG